MQQAEEANDNSIVVWYDRHLATSLGKEIEMSTA
jgi:hypothetical protein